MYVCIPPSQTRIHKQFSFSSQTNAEKNMDPRKEIDLRYYDPNTLLDSHHLSIKRIYLEAEPGIVADLYDGETDIRRTWALGVISKYSKCEHFDAFIPYVAINYFDRFISKAGVLVMCSDLRDNVLLLAISCLTLAWRLCREKFDLDLFLAQRSDLNKIDPLIISNLEANIVRVLFPNYHRGALPLTALSFVKFYVSVFQGTRGFRRKTIYQMIIQSQRDIYFTRFRPSIFAASVLLAACRFLYPKLYRGYFGLLYNRESFDLETLENCVEMMVNFCKAFGLRDLGLVVEMAEETEGEASGQRTEASEQAQGETSRQKNKETSTEEQVTDEKVKFCKAFGLCDLGQVTEMPEEMQGEASGQRTEAPEQAQGETSRQREEEQVTDEITEEEPSRKTDLKGKSIKKDQGVEMMPLRIRPKDSDAGTSKQVDTSKVKLESLETRREQPEDKRSLVEIMEMDFELQWVNETDEDITVGSPLLQTGEWGMRDSPPQPPADPDPQPKCCSCYTNCCRPM